MPFDSTSWNPEPKPPEKPARNGETVLLYGAFVIAVLLMLMPISAGALIDLWRYLAR